MDKITIKESQERATAIRNEYHKLEEKYHDSKWSISEDALAFMTDAGLVARAVMDVDERWPLGDTSIDLEDKIGECIWWLNVIAERADVDTSVAVEKFLNKMESKFDL